MIRTGFESSVFALVSYMVQLWARLAQACTAARMTFDAVIRVTTKGIYSYKKLLAHIMSCIFQYLDLVSKALRRVPVVYSRISKWQWVISGKPRSHGNIADAAHVAVGAVCWSTVARFSMEVRVQVLSDIFRLESGVVLYWFYDVMISLWSRSRLLLSHFNQSHKSCGRFESISSCSFVCLTLYLVSGVAKLAYSVTCCSSWFALHDSVLIGLA